MHNRSRSIDDGLPSIARCAVVSVSGSVRGLVALLLCVVVVVVVWGPSVLPFFFGRTANEGTKHKNSVDMHMYMHMVD